MCENPRKGKGKKEAPQVLERGFPPITKVTGFQPIYLSMKLTSLPKATLKLHPLSHNERLKQTYQRW